MDEELVSDWEYQHADLFEADLSPGAYPEGDIIEAADRAAEIVNIQPNNIKGYAIPVFELNQPKLTNQYVIYEKKNKKSAGTIQVPSAASNGKKTLKNSQRQK